MLITSFASGRTISSTTTKKILRRKTRSHRMTTSSSSSSSASTTTTSSSTSKDLWILRHGQATHNPRAEAAREEGCSFDKFFELMREDDSLDSPLTERGRQQASAVRELLSNSVSSQTKIELVVSSPLSRALETANLALPPSDDLHSASPTVTSRVCYEGFREINGVLQNARRRSVTQLCRLFPDWDFNCLPSEHDDAWDADSLEATEAAAARGLAGLRWLCRERSERSVLLVAHGGLLRHTMEQQQQHRVVLRDERRRQTTSKGANSQRVNGEKEEPSALRPVSARFGNCELRRYRLESQEDNKIIVLTEVDLFS